MGGPGNPKGVILAGGRGTRLYPLTAAMPKALLPVYDKPMLYYSIALLRAAGIYEQLVVTSQEHYAQICRALYELSLCERSLGRELAIKVAVQDRPAGVAHGLEQAYVKGFLKDDPFFFVLSDNLFLGDSLPEAMRAIGRTPLPLPNEHNVCEADKCWLFLQRRTDYHGYGVARLDDAGNVVDIIEKPKCWTDADAPVVTGLYFYNGSVAEHLSKLRPSWRGEYEISDLNRLFAQAGQVQYDMLSQARHSWFDLGQPDDLLAASQTLQKRQLSLGLIGSPERVAILDGQLDPMVYREASPACGYVEAALRR